MDISPDTDPSFGTDPHFLRPVSGAGLSGGGSGTEAAPFLLQPRPFAWGREHAVYLSAEDDGGHPSVIKVPRELRDGAFLAGEVWQNMSADAVEEDLALLDREGLPALYTEFFRDAYVRTLTPGRSPERRPRHYSYALRQPYFSRYPQLGLKNLDGHPAILAAFSEIMDTRDRLFRRHARGVDILGGNESYRNGLLYFYERYCRARGIGKSLPAFPFDPSIPNLLLPRRPVRAGGSLVGQRIVEAGKLVLGDVRLFRLGETAGFYRRALRAGLQFLHDLETGAAFEMLGEMGGDRDASWLTTGNRGNTLGREMARFIMADYNHRARHAAP